MNGFRARLARLEKATTDDKPVLLWIEPEESAETAVKRHLNAHPEDAGREVLCLSWMKPGHGPARQGAGITVGSEINHHTRMEN